MPAAGGRGTDPPPPRPPRPRVPKRPHEIAPRTICMAHSLQAQRVIELPIGEQPAVRGDLGAKEFQLHAAIEFDLAADRFGFALLELIDEAANGFVASVETPSLLDVRQNRRTSR